MAESLRFTMEPNDELALVVSALGRRHAVHLQRESGARRVDVGARMLIEWAVKVPATFA